MKKKFLSFVLAFCFVLPLALVLTACGPKTYDVTFMNGEEVYDTVTTLGNEEITLPQNPEKTNHIFDGWYLDNGTWENKLEKNTFIENPITEDVTVYAKWIKTFEVAFKDVQGNSLVNSQGQQIQNVRREDGDLLGEYQVPYKEGYEFVGWLLPNASELFDLTTPITSDLTLIAAFEIKVIEITFLYDGGEFLFEVAYGDSFLIPSSISVPTKVGYNGEWDREVFQNLTEDVTVRPVYTAKEFFMSLSYGEHYTGDISEYSIQVTYDSKVGTLPSPTHEGYTFTGWTYNGNEITSETIWQIDNPAGQITANWEIKTFTVTYKKDDSSEVVGEVEYNYNGQIVEGETPEVPEMEGYEGEWETNYFYHITGNKDVYAVYEGKWYNVKLNANGGYVYPNQVSVQMGETFLYKFNEPTFTAYEFVGWYLNGEKVEEDDLWATPKDNVELVAEWKVEDTGYIVTSSNEFKLNNLDYYFEVDHNSIRLVGKLRYAVTEFDLTGKFNVSEGATWVAYEDYNCTVQLENNIVPISSNEKTVYLKVTNQAGDSSRRYYVLIERNKMVEVSFYNKGEKVGDSVEVEEGSEIQVSSFPQVESETGFTFLGWESALEDGIIETSYTVVGETRFDAVFEYADTTSSQGLAYEIAEEGAVITGLGTCTDTDIVIPKFIDGKHYVIEIGERAFNENETITSVFIPNTIKAIRTQAFRHTYGLEEITFEENSTLEIIEDFAFAGAAIESIVIPKTVKSIPYGAMLGSCENLISLRIEDGNEKYYTPANSNAIVERYTSTGKFGLRVACKTTVIPEEVTIIETAAFIGIPITSITIPANVEIITTQAFSDCEKLETITFAANSKLTNIHDLVFRNCISLKSITFPDGIEQIIASALQGCTALETISNYDLDNYYIGNATGEMFTTLESLKTITTNPDSTTFAYNPNSNALVTKDGVLVAAFEKSVIPAGVTEIGQKAFYKNNKITSILIPNTVTKIGKRAFYWCENLETVTFEENSVLTEIGDEAFYECAKLNNVSIPNSVTKIGSYAFSYCESLTNVTLPAELTTLKEQAFSNTELVTVEIPAKLKKLNEYTFYNVPLEEVTFAENSQLEEIGAWCFQYSNLKRIKFPETLKEIWSAAFSGCMLEDVIIPSSVETIAYGAFGNMQQPGTINIYCEATSKPADWNTNWCVMPSSSNKHINIYWYSETEPTEEGNYWHYGTENEVLVWGAEV